MSILFIVNPAAGKSKASKLIPKITSHMENRKIHFKIINTEYPGHAKELASKAKEEGFDMVVAVGGDGTLYEVVNGGVGKDIKIGVIPAGTGNDLAKTLLIPRDTIGALDVIIAGKEKKIDLGKINGHYFINVAGAGFDCDVLVETQKLKKYLSGILAYIVGIFKALINYKPRKMELILDGKKLSEQVFLIAIANGKYYGGGMKVAPDADIQDGYFDICVVKHVSKLTVIKLLKTFVNGEHTKHPRVDTYKAKTIEIYSEKPFPVNADGEIAGSTPIKMECIPQILTVIVP